MFAFEEALIGPIATFESAELLAEAPADTSAAELLCEASPVPPQGTLEGLLRRDFAQCALERNPWADTFSAWCLGHYPSTFASLRSLLVAVVETYTARARNNDGVVLGTRFPFHDTPLVSASAHLALASLALGCHFDVAAKALDFIVAQRREDGGWGDGDDPADLLTTLAALELLGHFDPGFDPTLTVSSLIRQQGTDGFWRAFGPDAPWLTMMMLHQLEDMERHFSERSGSRVCNP